MARLIGMALFGLVIFAGAFGATWFVKSQQILQSATDEETVEESYTDEEAELNIIHVEAPDGATTAEKSPTPKGMPVAVRPRPMSIEELLRFGMGLNEREELLAKQAERIQRQEAQMKLAFADLKGEQQQIEALRTQVQQQLKVADSYLGKIQKARDDLAADRVQEENRMKEFETSRLEINSQQRDNIKQLSTWIQSMEPEKSADVLREMSNDGRMETAVKLLSQLEERDVAKILSALNDAKLVDQFITRFQDLKRPEKTASRR